MPTWKLRAALVAGGLVLAAHPLLLGSVVPWRDVPSVTDGQDPLLQTSILQQTLRAFPWSLERWHGPFSWPGAYSLAYMDPLAGQALLAAWMPGVRAFPALAYNVSLVATLWLAAACTYLLARSLGGGRVAGSAAALAYVVSPYATGHLQHLNQLPTPWLPLALWGLVQLVRGRSRGALALGGSLVMQTVSGVYYTLAVALVVGCVLPVVARRMPRRGWVGTGLALASFAVVLWVWSLPYRAAASEVEGFTRTTAESGPYAARIFDYWHASVTRWAPWPVAAVGRPVLYPSLVWMILAGLGWMRWASSTTGRDASRRGVVLGLLVASALGVILAFGRTMPVPGLDQEVTMPWAWLQDHVWPLRAIRAVSRLFLPATLAIALLGSWPLAHLLENRRGWGLALLALACLDLAPGRIGRVRVQLTADEEAVVEDLRVQPRPTPWALLPMPATEPEEGPADARAMLWAVLAQQPLAGGSTAFVPRELRALRSACATADCRAALEAAGVRRVIMDAAGGETWTDAPVMRAGRWTVYALNPGDREN